MATDLSLSSRFTRINLSWNLSGYVSTIRFQTSTDSDDTTLYTNIPSIYENPASDSHLGILQAIYASDDGFLDADGNALAPALSSFALSETKPTIEELAEYGGFNPFDANGYSQWLAKRQVDGAFIREGTYSEDADTGRPRVESPIDNIPTHRNPGSASFAFPLSPHWVASLVSNNIHFHRNYTLDDAVSNPNNDDSLIAFLAWLEGLRISGDTVGSSVLVTDIVNSLGSRTYRLDQGGEAATLDLEFSSSGRQLQDDDTNYAFLNIALRRITAETDAIDIQAIRTLLLTATGSIDVEADDEPEEPIIGATNVAVHASELVLPDNFRLGLVGKRLALKHPSMGVFPLDGAHVLGTSFEELEDIDGVTNGKWMPNTGHAVIHFGHTATAKGFLRYRTLGEMLESEGADLVQRVHNISETQDVDLQDMDGDLLIRLKPSQQSGPMQVALETAGDGGEILALKPPDRRVVLARGHSAPTFDQGTSYPFLNNGVDDHYHSLRVQPNALEYADTDVWSVGNDDDPASAYLNTITPSDLTIRGEYQILRSGWVSIALRYRLRITDPAPSGELAKGNGPSLWISEGGLATFVRDHTAVAEAFGGTGAQLEYHLRYYAYHEANTRFLILHYIPAASDIATADYDHIDQESLEGALILTPEIRKVVTA